MLKHNQHVPPGQPRIFNSPQFSLLSEGLGPDLAGRLLSSWRESGWIKVISRTSNCRRYVIYLPFASGSILQPLSSMGACGRGINSSTITWSARAIWDLQYCYNTWTELYLKRMIWDGMRKVYQHQGNLRRYWSQNFTIENTWCKTHSPRAARVQTSLRWSTRNASWHLLHW